MNLVKEQATIKFLNKFNRALIEIVSKFPKSLYDVLEMRRDSAKEKDDRLREFVLVNICLVIVVEKIDKILKEAMK